MKAWAEMALSQVIERSYGFNMYQVFKEMFCVKNICFFSFPLVTKPSSFEESTADFTTTFAQRILWERSKLRVPYLNRKTSKLYAFKGGILGSFVFK